MSRNAVPLGLLLTLVLWGCGEGSPSLGGSTQAALAQAGRAAATYDAPHAGRLDAGYRRGAAQAPVAVVEFSDFGCPYCGQFARTTFVELERQYIEAGLVRWRYVPVSFGFAGGALMGAAAICAGDQAGEDGFWLAHDLLYRHQTALRGADALERMLGWLEEGGLGRRALESCIRSPATAAVLEANNQLAQQWLVRGTPTFVINGVPMSGALPLSFFQQILDTALDPSGL